MFTLCKNKFTWESITFASIILKFKSCKLTGITKKIFRSDRFMKKLFVTFTLLLCFLLARSQKSADVGIRIGAAVYWGDIENADLSKGITPLYGVLGRWNFNKRMSIRGQLVTGRP